MSNLYLKPVFAAVYGREFEQSFEHRMEMQKAVYLLEEMGVPVGNYGFFWYKHGPYSQELQNDILELSTVEMLPVVFSNDNLLAIKRLRNLLSEQVDYSSSQWAECVASLHYIKMNLLPQSASEEDIVNALEEKKQHLIKHELNLRALKEVECLFS